MHLSTSPGGKIPSSSLNLPVLPPLSIIETIADMVMPCISRNPDRSANCPLPPPMVTTLKRASVDCLICTVRDSLSFVVSDLFIGKAIVSYFIQEINFGENDSAIHHCRTRSWDFKRSTLAKGSHGWTCRMADMTIQVDNGHKASHYYIVFELHDWWRRETRICQGFAKGAPNANIML